MPSHVSSTQTKCFSRFRQPSFSLFFVCLLYAANSFYRYKIWFFSLLPFEPHTTCFVITATHIFSHAHAYMAIVENFLAEKYQYFDRITDTKSLNGCHLRPLLIGIEWQSLLKGGNASHYASLYHLMRKIFQWNAQDES